MANGTISIGDTRKGLKAAGFRLTWGRHEKWEHEDGRMVTLPHIKGNGQIYGYMAKRIREWISIGQ